jgi:gustatory receptor
VAFGRFFHQTIKTNGSLEILSPQTVNIFVIMRYIRKIRLIISCLSIPSSFQLGEHLLSITVGAHGANNCPTIKDPVKAFYVRNYPQAWLIFSYNGWLASLIKFFNVILTFAWSYTDLFVIIISIGLTSKFEQLNDELRKMKGRRGINADYWSEYRVYYREIVGLVAVVDKAVSKIILISISNNLFFICVQLLRSLE